MKTKNLFFSMLAMTGMLFATSCSQDELLNEPSNGDFVNATFSIGTTDGIGTRATIGNGSKVDEVACAVFDEKGEEMTALRQYRPIESGKAEYSVRLAKGQDYRVAFFAYNSETNAYDVSDLKNVKVKNAQFSNVESRDAFTAYVDIDATVNAISKNVTLYRPFAQLNLGIDDTELQDAQNAGVVVDKSFIKVSNVYSIFSAYDDAVVGEPQSMEFALNDIPEEKLEVDVNRNGEIETNEYYTYLALNYLLVGDRGSKKTLTDVEFVWENEDGSKTNDPATTFINVPVQRNYRTNIIGKLLTNPATFNIVIDAKFNDVTDFDSPENDYIVNEDGSVSTTVSSLVELQNALDAAVANNKTIISFDAAITGDVNVTEKTGATILIDGCQNVYNGTFTIVGGSNDQGATTIFKNIKFETSESITFIYADASANGDNRRYPDNIVVDNCSFKATGGAVNNAVGLKVRSLKDKLTITNTTADGMHTLLQTNSCDKEAEEILVDYVTITNGKNGLSFRQSDAVTVSNTSIESTGYGIRADGYTNYGIKVQNCNIAAGYPVAITNMSGENYSIELEGNNTLTTSNSYQVIITNSKDEDELEAPTGNYTLTGADNFNVYPRDLLVGTEAELKAAYKNSDCKIIKLTNDITVAEKWDSRYAGQYTRPIVLDGAYHTITFTGAINNPNMNMVFDFDEAAEVKNLTIDMSQATVNNIGTHAISAKKDLVVDNCKFIGNQNASKSSAIYYAEGNRNEKIDMVVSVKNSIFTNWTRRGISDSENGEDIKSVVIEGNTFTNAHVYVSAYENITFVGNTMSSSLMNITSYTSASTAKVKAMGNTLDAEMNNVIGSPTKKFNAANVEAQNGIVVNVQ